MLDGVSSKQEIITRLEAVVNDGSLPRRVRSYARKSVTKLKAPIRIGLLGLPQSGKRDLLAALLGLDRSSASLPDTTMEFVSGSNIISSAILADGTSQETQGYPDFDGRDAQVAFVTVTHPKCTEMGRSFLIVACDPDPSDLFGALNWAADRVDIAIWCTRRWSLLEAAAWAEAPDQLKDHAILFLGHGDADHDQVKTAEFEYVEEFDAGYSDLTERLTGLIDGANAQDLLAVELFLNRFGASVDTGSSSAINLSVDKPETEHQPTPNARSELARLFNQVRSAASGLERVAREPSYDADAFVDELNDIFESLSDQMLESSDVAETWPDLERTVEEASDFALLLRVEGGADQATDAARLLLQLRYEMEEKLAA